MLATFLKEKPMERDQPDQPTEQNKPPPTLPKVDADKAPPREIGGPKGPEPTRYRDWERGGRCIDF